MANQPAIPLDDFWQQRAKLLRVMAHPVRLAILEALCERPHCVKHINSLIAIPQPHLSQHIAALRKVELVASHVCGPVRCYYILQPTLVKKLIGLLRQEHATRERKCEAVVREARRGWEAMEEDNSENTTGNKSTKESS